MRTLESETKSESSSMQKLEPVKENDDILTVPPAPDVHVRSASPNKKLSSLSPTKKRLPSRGKAQSTSTLTPGIGSGNLKNLSSSSIGNGKHSSHTSGHSSHNSHHSSNSGGSGPTRSRTVSVGSSKPVSSSSTSSQRRPSSGHTFHRDKRYSTAS